MLGTREGALRGLTAVGKEAVRRGLVQAGGGIIVAEDMDRAIEMGMDTRGVQQAMMVRATFDLLCAMNISSLLLRMHLKFSNLMRSNPPGRLLVL